MDYSFEFFALVLFVVVLAGILWIFEKTSEAGRNIMATLDSVKSDEQQVAEDLAFRNKAIYEADQYNQAASMEPFLGGGKRLTEKEKREELAKLNLHPMSNVPEHLRPDPYKTSYDPQYWQALFSEGKKP